MHRMVSRFHLPVINCPGLWSMPISLSFHCHWWSAWTSMATAFRAPGRYRSSM
ncbi:hypothetical protein PMIN01_10341 [Paraphaeosphaeria minitans]|uniref:Uncharacterized protein n=1 Tax=Paraphaeosphaeria minitans TaxID=565426 RepID=A0A9P6G9J7_9PLEO|nr:hypothetical protein PMIN01_10341 [Paraphaeosphaeria minitans]